jgi:hypothetical protein
MALEGAGVEGNRGLREGRFPLFCKVNRTTEKKEERLE